MELIVFDLDGTLLNSSAEISPFTRETLARLRERGILYTVATGRTLHASRKVLDGHGFSLPQAYKNGVLIWDPTQADYTHSAALTLAEIGHVVDAVQAEDITPFLFTLTRDNNVVVYHTPLRTTFEAGLVKEYTHHADVTVRPVEDLPADARITNISALGSAKAIETIQRSIEDEADLVAYAGVAYESDQVRWIDVHHAHASKGTAVDELRRQLGVSKVVCFGDSDNDLSMFATADEAYAPSNAKALVREAATAVIGHHDEDGIARFLRKRFDLGG